MGENPLQIILHTCENLTHCVKTQLSRFVDDNRHNQNFPSKKREPILPGLLPSLKKAVFGLSTEPVAENSITHQLLQTKGDLPPALAFKEDRYAKVVSKEELGRATWTLLHTLASQFPDHPTKQQKRDVKELMTILSRIYPCKECADHFKEVLKSNPVQSGSQAEFAQWMCHVHNVVNRSLGKVIFPCHRVDARWGKLECKERACDLEGTSTNF